MTSHELRRLVRRFIVAPLRLYRVALSPLLPHSCRFEPTCSAYAIGALQQHGALAGSALALGRIGRCHPWCAGGLDPVPAEPSRLFRALLASSPTTPSSRAPGASDAASS